MVPIFLYIYIYLCKYLSLYIRKNMNCGITLLFLTQIYGSCFCVFKAYRCLCRHLELCGRARSASSNGRECSVLKMFVLRPEAEVQTDMMQYKYSVVFSFFSRQYIRVTSAMKIIWDDCGTEIFSVFRLDVINIWYIIIFFNMTYYSFPCFIM